MRAADLTSVDLWIGTGGVPVSQMVVPVIKPSAFLPVHWDGFWDPFEAGVTKSYSDPGTEAFLAKAGIQLLRPTQYMDKWRLDRTGVRPIENARTKQMLGFH